MLRFAWAAALMTGVLAPLAPAHGYTAIGGASQQSVNVIADGTSNTILFSEDTTRLTFCFDNVSVQGASSIADGSSNTIQFGNSIQLRVTGGSAGPRQPIGAIADGSSNTILLGEYTLTDFCLADVSVPLNPIVDGSSNTILLGEQSGFDVCFDSVRRGGTIGDGTSNTIQFGETEWGVCYAGAVVAAEAASVDEPYAVAILGLGLIGLWWAVRRRTGAALRA